jgi:hypothetical protein
MAYHKEKLNTQKFLLEQRKIYFFLFKKLGKLTNMQVNTVLKKAQYSCTTLKIFYINLLDIFKACHNISAYNGRKSGTEPTTDCTTASSDWRGEQKFSIV